MSAVPFNHRLDVVFTPEEQAATAAELTSIESRMLPKLVHLDAADKKRMTRLGTGSVGFVNLSFGYASDNLQFKPGFLGMEAWKRDLDAMNYLLPLKQRLDKLSAAVEDTLILAGFEAYEAARMFYAALQSAVASKQPGAAAIYAELARHFSKRAVAFAVAVDPSLAPAASPAAASGSEFESESSGELHFEPPAMHE